MTSFPIIFGCLIRRLTTDVAYTNLYDILLVAYSLYRRRLSPRQGLKLLRIGHKGLELLRIGHKGLEQLRFGSEWLLAMLMPSLCREALLAMVMP